MTIENVPKISREAFNANIAMHINTEREKYKNGQCPECNGKLKRYATSYFHNKMYYGNPQCDTCKKEFYISWEGIKGSEYLPDPYDSIPKTGVEEFIELMNKPCTI